MNCVIEASKIKGRVTAPSSKSYTIRALFAAALAGGTSQLINPLYSDDTSAAISVLKNLGATITQNSNGLQVSGGPLSVSADPLKCRDSAATLRFATAICANLPGVSVLESGPSLEKRPILPLLEVLRTLGADFNYKNNLITIYGKPLEGGSHVISGDLSSQFVSALLFIAPLLKQSSAFQLDSPPRSRPYIEMTIETLRNFAVQVSTSSDYTLFKLSPQAYRPAVVTIEGDWSSAGYLLALGAIAGEVAVEGLDLMSLQGDKALIRILQKMGALILPDSNSVTVHASQLHAISFDMSQCIDLLPTTAVLAAVADGSTRLTGIARARLKESNRVEAVCKELGKLGIKVEEGRDTLVIHGGSPQSGVIDGYNDHRIAMAFGILALKVGGITITGANCVSKTFPDFWDILKMLGGKIKIENE